MYGTHITSDQDSELVLEAREDGGLKISITESFPLTDPLAELTLTGSQVDALKRWLSANPPPLASSGQVRTLSGIDYLSWRNRIRRAAGHHDTP